MPQINLTTAFQDASALGGPRELFLSGVPDGVVIAVEAGASLGAADGVEVGRLSTPNPGVVGAAGTTVYPYDGTAQFLRYRVVDGALGAGTIWVSGSIAATPPQIALTTALQDVSTLGDPREFFLAGAAAGSVVAIEAGASLVAGSVAEVARLYAPNPSAFGAAGTRAHYDGTAQFLRYRVVAGDAGSAVWMSGAALVATPTPSSSTFSVALHLPEGLGSGTYNPGPPGGYNLPIWTNDTGAPVWLVGLNWKQIQVVAPASPPPWIATAKHYSAAQPNVLIANIGEVSPELGIAPYVDVPFVGFDVTEIGIGESIYLGVAVGDGIGDALPILTVQATLSHIEP